MSRKSVIAAVAVAATLALPASAPAATKIFAGTTGPEAAPGQMAMDVVVNKKGKPKRITELRGMNLASNCDISGPLVQSMRRGVLIKVNKKGKFSGQITQPTYGNVSTIRGKFSSKRQVGGTFVLNRHFLADSQFPEENCNTGELPFTLKKGAPDVDPQFPPARR